MLLSVTQPEAGPLSFGVTQTDGSAWMDGVVDVSCPSSHEAVHEGGIGRIGLFTRLIGAVHEVFT